MFRRVYASQSIPLHMWGKLNIMNQAQASRVLPSLVPLTSGGAGATSPFLAAALTGSIVSPLTTEGNANALLSEATLLLSTLDVLTLVCTTSSPVASLLASSMKQHMIVNSISQSQHTL